MNSTTSIKSGGYGSDGYDSGVEELEQKDQCTVRTTQVVYQGQKGMMESVYFHQLDDKTWVDTHTAGEFERYRRTHDGILQKAGGPDFQAASITKTTGPDGKVICTEVQNHGQVPASLVEAALRGTQEEQLLLEDMDMKSVATSGSFPDSSCDDSVIMDPKDTNSASVTVQVKEGYAELFEDALAARREAGRSGASGRGDSFESHFSFEMVEAEA